MQKSQSDKCKPIVRKLEADESKANGEKRLKNAVKQKPSEKPE